MRAGSAGGREPRRYIQGLERVSKGTQASLRSHQLTQTENVEGGWTALRSGKERKEAPPLVVPALFAGLAAACARLSNDDEKRKAWVYEVPLPVVYHLRESVNAALPEQPIPLPLEVVDMYDAPVLASTVKLWMLELDPPLAL